MTFDVLVIGGGLAGFAAAFAAQQRGARTALVRAAPGASALVSGAWSGPLRTEIADALARAGYPMVPAPNPLAHERGRLIRCDFAGASHVGATADTDGVVCGIAGLPHFNATILAQVWGGTQGGMQAMMVELPSTPADGWTAAALAAAIERNPRILIDALKGRAPGRLILPAVLGIEGNAFVLASLKDAGIAASEALAVAPSIPGWRLLKAMERALAEAGITMLNGRAQVGGRADGRVHDVRVNGDVVSAKSFVLATGKFTAGGITAEGEFRENALGLPIWLEHLGDVYAAPDPLPLTDPVRTEDQPLLSVGVHTDEQLRPADRTGQAVYANVFAAGTIRAGWNAAERGLGECAEDGWAAGLNATV